MKLEKFGKLGFIWALHTEIEVYVAEHNFIFKVWIFVVLFTEIFIYQGFFIIVLVVLDWDIVVIIIVFFFIKIKKMKDCLVGVFFYYIRNALLFN